jgi:hypothetical protein
MLDEPAIGRRLWSDVDASESGLQPGDQTPRDNDSETPNGDGLSERDLAILDLERTWWRHAGSKERAIRERFSISPTRYYQLLNRLLDDPEAMRHDPMLVKRLRRLRASRSRARSHRPTDPDPHH